MGKLRKATVCFFSTIAISIANAVLAESDGGSLFQSQCSHCHAISSDAIPAVGPTLAGIYAKSAAMTEGYNYSNALKNSAAEGLRWDSATLDQFLASPRELVPGTMMGYPGMPNASDRQALVAWLENPGVQATTAVEVAINPSLQPDVDRILALTADPDYGEYLASECSTCHSRDGSSGGIPPIAGLPATYLVTALLEYTTGHRKNQAMALIAGGLGDDELVSLASYFSKQLPMLANCTDTGTKKC